MTQLESVYVTRTGAWCYCSGKCCQAFREQTKQKAHFSLIHGLSLSPEEYRAMGSLGAYLPTCGDVIGMMIAFAAWHRQGESRVLHFLGVKKKQRNTPIPI